MIVFYKVMSRTKVVLLFLAYAVALTLLEFTYRYLDFVTRRNATPWTSPFIEELTGVFGGVALMLPVAIWMAKHYRLDTFEWKRNVLLHLAAIPVVSVMHTTLNWGSRAVMFPIVGLGRYNYGDMPTRYFMELPSDVIWYSMTVGLATLYYRQLRAVQLEKTLAKAQLHLPEPL